MNSQTKVYQYDQSRGADVAKLFLDEYQGVVQTDGYTGYDFLDSWSDILHVGVLGSCPPQICGGGVRTFEKEQPEGQ